MADGPDPDAGEGRRVLGRSRGTGPERVVVDPSAPASGGSGAPAAPPAAAPPSAAPPAAAPPAPPVVPPEERPWNRPDERRVLGSSRPATGAVVAPDAARPVTGSGSGAPPAAPPPSSLRSPGGAGGARPPRTRRRVRPRTVVALVVAFVVLVPLLAFAFGWWQYSRIPKVDVADVLSPRAGRRGTNYLVVGTDSREGITADDPNAGAFLGETVTGARTDTIMVMHVEGSTVQLASVPRDLWVTDPATGEQGRINSTFAAGPANLILAVEQLGIPVDHYLEINFVSFAKLVDAVGGITIDVPYPARDTHSGLLIEQAGPNRLDGEQALAYVRSRFYEEQIDGRWVTDPTADIGRTERQRKFLTALMQEITNERNPFSVLRIPGSMGAGMKIDSTLGYLDALRLGWKLRGADIEPVAIPVTPRTTSGGAAVLELETGSADVIAGLAR